MAELLMGKQTRPRATSSGGRAQGSECGESSSTNAHWFSLFAQRFAPHQGDAGGSRPRALSSSALWQFTQHCHHHADEPDYREDVEGNGDYTRSRWPIQANPMIARQISGSIARSR
jgi:hypothetical protein